MFIEMTQMLDFVNIGCKRTDRHVSVLILVQIYPQLRKSKLPHNCSHHCIILVKQCNKKVDKN